MDCVTCIVFPTSKQEWMAQLENGSVGPFMSRDIALQVAAIEALRLRQLDRPARLVVAAHDGTVCAERCICRRFGR
jgi:hypothetical protein